MMKFRIIAVHPETNSIVVSYFTDLIDEATLNGRGTYSINMPVPMLSGLALSEYILSRGPLHALTEMEVLLANTPDLTEIHGLVGTVVNTPTPIAPTSAEILATAKVDKINAINLACRLYIMSGFTSSALGGVYTYDSKDEDQLNLIGVLSLGVDSPYKCTDGAGVKAFLMHTIAQLQQVAKDGSVFKMAALTKVDALKNQITSATTLANVNNVVW